MKLDPFLTSGTRMNSRWMSDLSVKMETTQILEENRGEFLFNLGVDKDILTMAQHLEVNQWTRMDRFDYLKNLKIHMAEAAISKPKTWQAGKKYFQCTSQVKE